MKDEILIETYKRLNSTYKVAEELGVTRHKVKTRLKELGLLNTQSQAAKNRPSTGFFYKRTEKHRENLRNLTKARNGQNSPLYGKKLKEETKLKISEKAKLRTAERNPNYKDGQYVRRPRDFKIGEFQPIRNFVFNRDDYTCKYCKNMGGHLHAHHVIPYWVLPEGFLDSDNIVTVCTDCHFKQAHKGNWQKFDVTLVDERLLRKYKLCRERLNEKGGN